MTTLLILSGCTEEKKVPAGSVPETGGRAAETELASEFEFEGYPGNQWYGPEGEEIPKRSEIINVIVGPEHCEWQSATMMHVGKPLGDPGGPGSFDLYIRDPERVMPQQPLMSKLVLDARLPEDASYSGYRTDFMELWLDPDNEGAAFLVFANHVERWPKADQDSDHAVACG